MNRATFIQKLRNYLSDDLSAYEIERSVNYFNEMISDRVEEGMTEEEAVADIGDVRLVAEKILTEERGSLLGQIKSQVLPKKTLAGWQKVLMVLGFPLWGALCLAALALCLALFAIFLAFWVVAGALTLAGVTTILASPFKLMEGVPLAIFTAASGFIILGLGLLALRGAYALSQKLLSAYRRFRSKGRGMSV